MKVPFHPLLFAVYPVISMIAINFDAVVFQEAPRSFCVVLAFGSVLYLLLRIAVRDWQNAALISSMFLILFFSFGHIEGFFKEIIVFGLDLGELNFALWLYLALLVFWIWAVLQERVNPKTLNQALTLIALITIIFPAFSITSYLLRMRSIEEKLSQGVGEPLSGEQTQALAFQEYPDIYYIIVDGYPRADILAELYGIDNTQLLEFLSDSGFYVAEKSVSNYNQTMLSLASSFNMVYLDEGVELLSKDLEDRRPLGKLVRDNQVRAILESHGYQTVAFVSGYEGTSIPDVDHYMSPERPEGYLRLNKFELSLLNSTILKNLFNLKLPLLQKFWLTTLQAPFQDHRDNVSFAFSHLADFASAGGHYFVFAHIISPHPPFLFDAQGNPLPVEGAYVLNDGSGYPGSREEYIQGYRQQVLFVNTQLMRVINKILAESDTPPVIILQSDHGPGAYLAWNSVEDTDLDERMGILNAYYFPDGGQDLLYPGITPVNTFRVLFNYYFGYQFTRLPDNSYFAFWETPYNLIDITKEISP